MALISEWMQQCGKKVLDNAGIVREACSQQLTALCDTCETCTFISRICRFIGAELARLPETG
jgi:hypothetical protein